MTRKTGLVWHETFMWHQQGKYSGLLPGVYPVQPGSHVEGPEPKRRIKNLLDATGMTAKLSVIEPRPATDIELERAHSKAYLAQLAHDNALPEASAGFDAPFSRGSVDLARLAAGGVILAAERVASGALDNAYALVRPIGHHAEAAEGKGFCLINNAAVAAAHLLATTDIRRIAFVDVDVHHGNGAENIFWRDPRVLTISIHQERWFPPDTGDVASIGAGSGEHFNINVPLPAGCGHGAYEAAFEQVVLPALELYRPEFIFVPFGYDAGAQDPLGRMIVSSNGFRAMAQRLVEVADRHAGGRLVATQEGGYNESTTPFMALAVIEALAGQSSGVDDPYAPIMDGMFGHDLLDHQQAAIDRAKSLLAGLRDAVGKS
ncbi:deacetylase, histone deacetylase/acetoin utilization protein [Caulobacter sp. AP07]|uniref:class II histone deacetylase n=1 Tax=Caulobacter sp. AP07 TaxID=1144304 RepID=UPI000271EDE8|nr:class II histone deacetylase [Caulobacter sp. AP07]EJL30816.1 deacetylase, histone deacetylase/acetoin utilization protein [Caulobacter sp. AP07]